MITLLNKIQNKIKYWIHFFNILANKKWNNQYLMIKNMKNIKYVLINKLLKINNKIILI